jgi:hypothetical protein
MTVIDTPMTPKQKKIIAGICLVLMATAAFGWFRYGTANRKYSEAKGQLVLQDKEWKDKEKSWNAEKITLLADLSKTQAERDAYKQDVTDLKASLKELRDNLIVALKKIETLTPAEQVVRLQTYFGKNEVSLLGVGIVFSLKAAQDVDRLWLSNQFNLAEIKTKTTIITNYETKIIPSLESDLAKARKATLDCDDAVKTCAADLLTTRTALKNLERTISVNKWKHIGEGAVIGIIGTFVIQSLIKKQEPEQE